MLIPVILSGGIGSRLWPLSREYYPKQLLALVGDNTLLQDTSLRLTGLPQLDKPIIVCNETHRFLVAEQLRQIDQLTRRIILEPVGRNTAPAVAIAAFEALSNDKNAILLILPADHIIQQADAFREAVNEGYPLAQEGRLVTFGIVPSHPETGYGYIKTQDVMLPDTEAFKVSQFVEKPDLTTAQHYVQSGDYYWNSGMFMFKAERFLQELQKFNPDMYGACHQAIDNAIEDIDFLRLDEAAFKLSPSDSIDYAVMEKTDDAVVIPLNAGWNDVGSWSSLWEISQQNEQGNVLHGDVLTQDVKNCYLRSEYRLVAAIGLEDHVVIETADAVLVSHRDKVQDIKEIVNLLKQQNREEVNLHRRVHRPWGTYENIDVESRFQVKRIMVNPGACMSLQMHYHRSEHWVVVKGTAKVTCGDKVFIVTENQSTYIPLGTKHRLENPGKVPLEIIEVQSGSYLGEDDIVRFDDDYGRI
jgi:mannose-1-phosphate guanylyltransferase/mannose-6-phosphate isomerase